MKRALISAGCVVCLVLSGMAESREKPKGKPADVAPVSEGVCDGLKGETLGLYGLCVAFHLGMACEPDFDNTANPFAACPPGSSKVLAQYRKKMQGDDADMPGIQGPCPCWSSVELLQLRRPAQDDVTSCHIDQMSPAFANLDHWTVSEGFGFDRRLTSVQTMEEDLAFGGNGSSCILRDDPQGVFRNLSITHEEFLACEPGVAWSAADRGIACVIHSEDAAGVWAPSQ